MPRGQSFFDQVDEEDRRARVEAAERRNAEVRAQEERAEAARRASSKIFSMRANAAQLVEQYVAAGVRPPIVDLDGVPTVSLSLLLTTGWRIEEETRDETEHGGEVRRKLTKPPAIPPARRARGRNDEQGS